MATYFWRWKDASCNGENIEWIQMNKTEFKQFLRTGESKGRYFVRLGNEICRDADVIFIESTYEKYRDWYLEIQHHYYLSRVGMKFERVSLDYQDENDELSLHEIIADTGIDPEEAAVDCEMQNLVYMALSILTESRREAILAKYFKYPDKTDEEIANMLGVSYDVFNIRKFRALKQLKKFFQDGV